MFFLHFVYFYFAIYFLYAQITLSFLETIPRTKLTTYHTTPIYLKRINLLRYRNLILMYKSNV